MSSSDNRRNINRFPTYVAVRFRLTPAGKAPEDWQEGIMISASPNGAFVRTEEKFSLNEQVEIAMPTEAGHITLAGKIAWLGQARPHGIGIYIHNVDKEMELRILSEIVSGRWLAEKGEERKKSESGFFSCDIADLLRNI